MILTIDFFISVQFYLRPSGRINLRLNNFTFYKHMKARANAHRWSCTAYGSKWKCRAHLVITDRLEVLKANVTHSHPPSLMHVDEKGRHIKVKKETISNELIKKPVPPLLPTPLSPPHYNYFMTHSIFNNF